MSHLRLFSLVIASLFITELSMAKTPGVAQPTPKEAQENPFLFVNEQKAGKTAPVENHLFRKVQRVYSITPDNPIVTIQLPVGVSTGYQWFIQEYPTQWVKIQKYYIVNNNPPDIIGGTQEVVWTFHIAPDCFLSPQSIPLKFVYGHTWEDNNDSQPLVITILTSV